MKLRKKRLLVIADLHCGHHAGLTPPDWWYDHETTDSRVQAIYAQQKAMWDWYSQTVKQLRPIDVLFVNGDLVDGKGGRSGGTEQRIADRIEQAKMAAACINEVRAPRVMITYGTPYHTGTDEDMEDAVVPLVKGCVEIHSHAFVEINGLIFDLRHYIANSSIPHGRWTALARDKLWNQVWHNEHDLQPDSDILIRAHVHSYKGCFDADNWIAMTCPGLQGFGSKFGKRRCSNVVHIGMLIFDIESNGSYQWHPELLRLQLHKAPVFKW